MADKPDNISRKDWNDVDVPELTDEEMSRMRPAGEVIPEVAAAHRAGGLKRSRGERRPHGRGTKLPVSIRLSPDVVAHFKSTGKGWQTRIDEALKEWITEHDKSTG